MNAAVLTLNAGSSTLKFALFPAAGGPPLASGLADRIGPAGTLRLKAADGATLAVPEGGCESHAAALSSALAALAAALPQARVAAVGHRVVHGGPGRDRPARLDAALLAELEALAPFAPLHQPHNLAGIRAAMAEFPGVVQVACFDTAFHRGHPFVHDAYALPRDLYDRGVRRYGFHGLSYEHIAAELARRDPALAAGGVVVAHLGSGASLCAMTGGRAVATTMGFSALDGLVMGTRPGQLDPGVLLYLLERGGMDAAALSDLLYRRSGLLGLSGISADMRELEASPAPEAAEAIACFVARLREGVAAMAAAAGGIGALVFTGGIGENSARVRAETCAGLGWMGIAADPARNRAHAAVISPEGAAVAVLVIPTDEEGVIAAAARAALVA